MVLDEGLRASPIERLGLEEADERQLLLILGFKRRRRARRRQRLILTGLIGAMLALLILSPVGKTLVSRTRPTEPPLTDEISASPIVEKTPRAAETLRPRPGLAVAETSLPNPEVRALQPARRGESPETPATLTRCDAGYRARARTRRRRLGQPPGPANRRGRESR